MYKSITCQSVCFFVSLPADSRLNNRIIWRRRIAWRHTRQVGALVGCASRHAAIFSSEHVVAFRCSTISRVRMRQISGASLSLHLACMNYGDVCWCVHARIRDVLWGRVVARRVHSSPACDKNK